MVGLFISWCIFGIIEEILLIVREKEVYKWDYIKLNVMNDYYKIGKNFKLKDRGKRVLY